MSFCSDTIPPTSWMRSIWPWLEEVGPCILVSQAERACELRHTEMPEPANIRSLNW